jgi:hypothetical protein
MKTLQYLEQVYSFDTDTLHGAEQHATQHAAISDPDWAPRKLQELIDDLYRSFRAAKLRTEEEARVRQGKVQLSPILTLPNMERKLSFKGPVMRAVRVKA